MTTTKQNKKTFLQKYREKSKLEKLRVEKKAMDEMIDLVLKDNKRRVKEIEAELKRLNQMAEINHEKMKELLR